MKQLTKMIGSLTAKFAALLLTFGLVGSSWGADPVTIKDAGEADISVYEVSPGFYQNGANYDSTTDFYITSKDGLKYFRDWVNGTSAAMNHCYDSGLLGKSLNSLATEAGMSGRNIHLLANIDLTGEVWQPIGTQNKKVSDVFSSSWKGCCYGNFYGHGHVVRNIDTSLSAQGNGEKDFPQGFFGYYGTSNKVIDGLILENVKAVSTYGYAGAIVGNFGSSPNTIKNCKVRGVIEISGFYSGAICGIGSANVVNCEISGDDGSTISGTLFAGGLVGSERGGTELSITGNNVNGVAITSTQYAGALVGAMATGASGSCKVSGNTVGAAVTVNGNNATPDTLMASNPGGATTPTIEDNTIVLPVAQIGTEKYFTLEAAFAAAVNGNTITLLANTTLTQTIQVLKDASSRSRSLTLDLNGYTVSCSGSGQFYMVDGSRTTSFTVIDGSSAKTGKIAATNEKALFNYYGTLNLNAGTFEGSKIVYISQGTVNVNANVTLTTSATYAAEIASSGGLLVLNAKSVVAGKVRVSHQGATVRVSGGTIEGGINAEPGKIELSAGAINGLVNLNDASFTMTGGNVTVGSGYAVKATTKNCTVTISGGKIDGDTRGLNIDAGANATITGGELSGATYDLRSDSLPTTTGKTTISDGTFGTVYDMYGKTEITGGNFASVTSYQGTKFISGGYFKNAPQASLIADGYTCVDNPDSNSAEYAKKVVVNSYTVTLKDSTGAVLYSNDAVPYGTIVGADIAVPEGYMFGGWTQENGDAFDNDGLGIAVKDNLVLTVTWAKIVAKIGDVEYTSLQQALNTAATAGVDVTVELLTDIELTEWSAVALNGYNGSAKNIVVQGNNKTIKGLTQPLFASTWSATTVKIYDLTVKDSTISAVETSVGKCSAAFIGAISASKGTVIQNCHVENCTFTGGKYTGAFIGYAAGYSIQNNGPAFSDITITQCSVTGCTFNGTGSSGAIMGHATGDPWTAVVVTDTTVTGNSVKGENAAKTGILFGTSGAGATAYGKDGGLWFSATESNNKLYVADGTELTGESVHEVGRIGSPQGVITVTSGGSYTVDPTLTSDPATGKIATSEDFEVSTSEGVYTVTAMPPVAKIGETTYTTLQKAVDAAYDMTGDVTIEFVADITGRAIVHQKENLNLTIDGIGNKLHGQIMIYGAGRDKGEETLTLKRIAFEDNKDNFYYNASPEVDADAFIMMPSAKVNGWPYYNANENSHPHNLTVSDCSFTNTGTYDVVGIKSNSGIDGLSGLVVENCTGSKLHSLAQITALKNNGSFTNCKITGSGSFINFSGGTAPISIENCKFESVSADGYAIRENGNSTAVITLKDNNFKAFNVLAMGKNARSKGEGTINVVSGIYNGSIYVAPDSQATATFAISGGHFSAKIPQEYCAPGYVAKDGIWNADTPLTPNGVVTALAKIGETYYENLETAFAAVQDGQTITLLADCAGNGIKAPQGKFTNGITVDFNGHTYTVDGDTVGSTGTETNGFQLLKDNKITFKNGTITSTKAKILVQNYSDLTLDNMTLTLNNASYASAYTLSNNNGTVVINDTTINANPAGGFAFDVCRYAS